MVGHPIKRRGHEIRDLDGRWLDGRVVVGRLSAELLAWRSLGDELLEELPGLFARPDADEALDVLLAKLEAMRPSS